MQAGPTRLDFGTNPNPFSPSQIEVLKICRTGEDVIFLTSGEAQFIPACIEFLVENGGQVVILCPTVLNAAYVSCVAEQTSTNIAKPINVLLIHATGEQSTKEKCKNANLIIGTPTTIQWYIEQEQIDGANIKLLIFDSADTLLGNKQYDSSIFELYGTISRLEKIPQMLAFSKSYTKQALNALKRYMTEPREVDLLSKRAKEYKVFVHTINSNQPMEQQTQERLTKLIEVLSLTYKQCIIFSNDKALSMAAFKRITDEGLNVGVFNPLLHTNEPILFVYDPHAQSMNKEIYSKIDLVISIDGQRFHSGQKNMPHLFGDFCGKEGSEAVVSIIFVDASELTSFATLCQEQSIQWEKLPTDLTAIGMKPQLSDWLEQDGNQPWTVTQANMKETMEAVRQIFDEEFEENPKKSNTRKDVVQILPTQDILATLKEAGWATPGPLSSLMETEQWSQPRNTDVRNRITMWQDAVHLATKDKPKHVITIENSKSKEPKGYCSQIPPEIILPLTEPPSSSPQPTGSARTPPTTRAGTRATPPSPIVTHTPESHSQKLSDDFYTYY